MTGPRRGRCLGDRVADLADGRLDATATERAYAHLASCGRCRVELDAQRQVSADLGATAPLEPSADLLSRLRGIAVPAPSVIPEQPPTGTHPRGGAGVRPSAVTGPSRPSAGRRRRARVALASAAGAAAFALAAVLGSGSVASPGPALTSPSIAPVVDRLTDAHASTADRMPFSGPRVLYAGFRSATPVGPSSSRP